MTDNFCSACGKSVEPGTHFCPNCAHPVDGGAAQQSPALAAGGPDRRKKRNLLFAGIAVLVVVGLAVGLTLLLTRSSQRSGELFLESATSTGANPFTDSTATATGTSTTTTTTSGTPTSAPATTTEGQTVVPPKSWRVSYAAFGVVLDSLIS